MEKSHSVAGGGCPVALEINVSHEYKTDEAGVLEFRIRNQGPRPIRSLDLTVESEHGKSSTPITQVVNLTPLSEIRVSVEFKPRRAGETPLEIRVCFEHDDLLPFVYGARAHLFIFPPEGARSCSTSFDINIHEVGRFTGNDLSSLVTTAGDEKEINEDRLREKMERNEPFWMAANLELNEEETARERAAFRRLLFLPDGQAPPRTSRAVFESLESAAACRVFVYSMPELRFGRHTQKNDVVLRFLPDFQDDERSKSISAEQFVARHQPDKCVVSLAGGAHAPMSFGGRVMKPGDQAVLSPGAEIKIGNLEFSLRISGTARTADTLGTPVFEKLRRADPGDDPFQSSSWNAWVFSRTTNGPEESYVWLLRKMELGWRLESPTSLVLDGSTAPGARLSFWRGRYYLEALNTRQQVAVAGRVLEPGEIACLGQHAEISFGALRFQWKLS